MTTTQTKIEFTRVNNDVNGNPRYACHFTDLLNEQDKADYPLRLSPVFKVNDNINARYAIALRRARILGGKRFHNKQYGGGIVFQSYNIQATEARIHELLETGS